MSAELVEIEQPSAEFTETALILDDGLSQEEWAEVGSRLGRAHRASAWWIGDWINYGERAGYVSRDKYEMVEEITRLKRGTLWVYASVARRFEILNRIKDLTFGHHQLVRALDDAAEWLAQALEEGWSRDRLRAELGLIADTGLGVYEIHTKRHQEIAEAAARRLYDGLSGIQGYCSGLAELRLERAIAAAKDGDIAAWKHAAGEASMLLNTLKRQLKEAS